jgi:hypothetical protein
MKKPNSSAADRTCAIWPEVLMPQENHAPKIVELDGPVVRVIGLDFGDGMPAYHYRLPGVWAALCGRKFKVDYEESKNMGTCQQCRIEASRQRATVR